MRIGVLHRPTRLLRSKHHYVHVVERTLVSECDYVDVVNRGFGEGGGWKLIPLSRKILG